MKTECVVGKSLVILNETVKRNFSDPYVKYN